MNKRRRNVRYIGCIEPPTGPTAGYYPSRPSAAFFDHSKKGIYCSDDQTKKNYFIKYESDGVTLITKKCEFVSDYPQSVSLIFSLTRHVGHIYIACGEKGLFRISVETQVKTNVHHGDVAALTMNSDGLLIWADNTAKKIYSQSYDSEQVTILAGCGKYDNKDGDFSSCSFKYVTGLCSEFNSFYVADHKSKSIRLMTPIDGTICFLENLGTLYDAFGVHSKGVITKPLPLVTVISKIKTVEYYF